MPHRIFAPAARYPQDPRAVFILGLCVLAGLPLIFGEAAPSSLESLLPAWIVFCWGMVLSIGAAVTLAGMSSQSVGGVIVEQLGSAVVGASSLFYASGIVIAQGISGTFPAIAYIAGFGLACLWRWGQLQSWLHHTSKVVDEARSDDS